MQRWFRLLGYHNPRPKKRVDPNGHERADVVKRRKEYLQELEEFQRLSTRYEEHNGVAVQIPPTLNDGETEHVLSSTMSVRCILRNTRLFAGGNTMVKSFTARSPGEL